MTVTRYNIDLQENTKLSRILKTALGAVCLAIAVWFIFSMGGTRASTGTAWIAVIFLILFSLWFILSGLGFTDRYIIVGEDCIILRHNLFIRPVKISSASLTGVEFKPLQIDFFMGKKRVSVRLGAYYPDHSAAIMEAVEEFCRKKGIEINDTQSGEINEQRS
jgi:hypothetical protein